MITPTEANSISGAENLPVEDYVPDVVRFKLEQKGYTRHSANAQTLWIAEQTAREMGKPYQVLSLNSRRDGRCLAYVVSAVDADGNPRFLDGGVEVRCERSWQPEPALAVSA